MVIFFNMIVKKNLFTYLILGVYLLPLLLVSGVKASNPSLSFYPTNGVIKSVDDGFTVDILIDSGEYDLTKARMVFNFDPEIIQISKASRNNSLFDQWPSDESTLDNTNGVVMLTGFTQSGSNDLYSTTGDSDVLARLEFDIVDNLEQDILLEWEFTGSDDLFKSVLMADGSPPTNVLTVRPANATFTYGQLTQTAIEQKHLPFIIGGLLILGAGVVITSKPSSTRKKFGTVVVYDE